MIAATGKHSQRPRLVEHHPQARVHHAAKLDGVDLKNQRYLFALQRNVTCHDDKLGVLRFLACCLTLTKESLSLEGDPMRKIASLQLQMLEQAPLYSCPGRFTGCLMRTK